MKLVFTGDLFVSDSKVPELSIELKSIFECAEIVCVNLEAPICDGGILPALKMGPAIAQNFSVIDFLASCGTSHVNLANNHMMDFGEKGLEQTISNLNGVICFGAGNTFDKAYECKYIDISGKRIALLAFAEAQFGVLAEENSDTAGFAWFDHPQARAVVARSKQKADYVIVQVHAGLEMVDVPLPELRARYREFIEIGADLVIGHHPHVIQGLERHMGKDIYYSLGNFYMDMFFDQDKSGSGAVLEVLIEDGTISSRLIPLNVSRGFVDVDHSGEQLENFRHLSDILLDRTAYIARIDLVCDDFFRDIYSGYYEIALTGLGLDPHPLAFKRVLRRLVALVLGRKRARGQGELLLLHNIKIETHRWVVERALKNRISD